jgi:hypothetical protein
VADLVVVSENEERKRAMSRQHGRLRARSLLVLPCLVGPVLAIGPVSAATAAPISHCTTTSGVIVVVDFRHFGGAIDRGCAPTPTTGYDALHNAGYTTSPDNEDGPAFVCRIDGKPTPAQEPCDRTPPTSSAWSYWYADPGHNSWSFHDLGAMSTHPKPGSVDAWVFGSTVGGGYNGEPSFSPASVRATATSPTPTPAPTHVVTSPRPRHHRHVSPTATSATTPSASPTGTARTQRRRRKHPAAASPTRSPSPSPGASGLRIVDQTGPGPEAGTSKGSPTGLLIGLALIVVLGGAAGVTAWRRRRSP